MAIVRTTTKETNSGSGPPQGNGASSPQPVDRTKSVVKSTNPPVRPVVRGGVNRAPVPTATRRGRFVQETRAELQKVVWPSREDVRSGTIVTILLLIVFGTYIFGLDRFFNWLFSSNALGLYPEIVAPR